MPTLWPWPARMRAAVMPDGPAPTTATSRSMESRKSAMKVSTIPRVEESIVILDWSRQQTRQENLARMERILLASHKIRCHGSAALDLCSIAAGQLEAFVHPRLMPWDFAAGQLIVEEAGGRVTTLEGAERTLAAGSVLATNGKVHAEILALLQD